MKPLVVVSGPGLFRFFDFVGQSEAENAIKENTSSEKYYFQQDFCFQFLKKRGGGGKLEIANVFLREDSLKNRCGSI